MRSGSGAGMPSIRVLARSNSLVHACGLPINKRIVVRGNRGMPSSYL